MGTGLAGRMREGISDFFPGYFALVMATGILSIGNHFLFSSSLALALFALNLVCYAVLWLITLCRLCWFPRNLFHDLTHHARGVTFLTMVAATMILGSQFALLTPARTFAAGLWILGIALWLLLVYTFFMAITVRSQKPVLEEGLNGAWMIITVSTESICVLATLVAQAFPRPEAVLFIGLGAYLLGAMFYMVFITLMLYRWSFFSLSANKLTPPYWINMGALAISTLAGARLLLAAPGWPLLHSLSVVITALTLAFWVAAVWWIPLLVMLGAWRHLIERIPLRYEPPYWSLVFPLGMFAVATHLLGRALNFNMLDTIAYAFLVFAMTAWTLTFIGMLRRMFRVLLGTPPVPQKG